MLASLQIEREAAETPKGKGEKGGASIEDRVEFADEGAREYWGSVFRS